MSMEETPDAGDAARRHLILTELFGVHPRAIVDALVVAANEHLYILSSRLEDAVREQLGDTEEAARQAEKGVHCITTLLENAIDHTMDTFELYCMRSIFVVTPEQSGLMTMAHHRGLDLRERADAQQDEEEDARDGEARMRIIPPHEDDLRRKVACASATQHRLAQAERAATMRRERAEALRTALAFILDGARRVAHTASGDPTKVADSFQECVNAVLGNADDVINALSHLQDSHPLTAPLLARAASGEEGAEEGSPAEGRREWERGRDEYLNWEASRIIASMKRPQAGR
ncbi:hypothetical protein MSPP1_000861 [Malassezia sp. CBS 17886]|nr:hypothetical protein MSPP1_000861 [Malassezia sp. CBS 17886]